jgi:RimJ/RimL family protein N-acetyltransferase
MAQDLNVRPVTLKGRYVRLEPLEKQHAAGMADVGVDSEIWLHMPYGDINSREQVEAWVDKLLEQAQSGVAVPFAVIHLESGRIAGATRYMDIRPAHRGLEIGGTWYGAEFRRTVVNTEAKFLLLRHAFEELGCIRVQLKTDSRNQRSQRAIERLGAVREGVLRNHMILPDGIIRHSVYYSIVESEWPTVKQGLLAKLSG